MRDVREELTAPCLVRTETFGHLVERATETLNLARAALLYPRLVIARGNTVGGLHHVGDGRGEPAARASDQDDGEDDQDDPDRDERTAVLVAPEHESADQRRQSHDRGDEERQDDDELADEMAAHPAPGLGATRWP